MIYLELFISFFKIGAFSFGGGYVAMPLIRSEVVDANNWLTVSEFTDLIAISQMTPGPIAINAATFVGIRVAGVLGAAAATLGCVLPSCIVVGTLACIYIKYRELSTLQSVLYMLRPAVVAMIAASGIAILQNAFFKNEIIELKNIKIHMITIFIICTVLLLKYKKNPIFVIILAGVLNLLYNAVLAGG